MGSNPVAVTHLHLVPAKRSYIILKQTCMTFYWTPSFKGFNFRSATESELQSVCSSFQNEAFFRTKSVYVILLTIFGHFFYKYMYTLHDQIKRTRRLPGTNTYNGCRGLMK